MSLYGIMKICTVLYRLNIKPDVKPVKQQQQRFRPDIMKTIEAKVYKLIEYSFIREEQHPDWVANIVPVLKKNGKNPGLY